MTDKCLRMRARIVRLDGVVSSSRVGTMVEKLSSIGHGGGRLTVKLNSAVVVEA